MAVYVDDFNSAATVGRHTSQWSHLFADTQEELHAFAARLGLKREWFQPGKPLGGKPSPHWRYDDVTAGKRARALALGAQRVPPCGAPAPDQPPGESATTFADAASRAAGQAYHRGDLAEASRLIADARALDPSREQMWAERERYLKREAAQRTPYGLPLEEQTRQRMAEHGIKPDDPRLRAIAVHNARVMEAGR